MNKWDEKVTNLGNEAIKRIRFSNAMGTPLAFVVCVSIPSFSFYAFTSHWAYLVFAFIPIANFIYTLNFFMHKKPRYLRTEEHEERMLAIKMGTMGEKGHTLPESTIDAFPDEAIIVDKYQKKEKVLTKGSRQ